eukprot:6273364-Pyramimonas_sp.AAC.2
MNAHNIHIDAHNVHTNAHKVHTSEAFRSPATRRQGRMADLTGPFVDIASCFTGAPVPVTARVHVTPQS